MSEKKMPRYSIVACGGGGCNILAGNMERLGRFAALYALDSDAERLADDFGSNASVHGLPISRPETVDIPDDKDETTCVPEELAEPIRLLKEASLPVIIYVCLGGRTGSNTANDLAIACKREGLLVHVIASTPFHLETDRRQRAAKASLASLSDQTDTIISISNEMSLQLTNAPKKLVNAFQMTDSAFARLTMLLDTS